MPQKPPNRDYTERYRDRKPTTDLERHNWYADESGVWCVNCHKDPYNCKCSVEFHTEHKKSC